MNKKENKLNKQKKSKRERLEIVLSIINKLKTFPKQVITTNNSLFVNLYNFEYNAIKELKKIFDRYINQEDNLSIGISGKIHFSEINRTIQYNLPVGKNSQPLFLLKCN